MIAKNRPLHRWGEVFAFSSSQDTVETFERRFSAAMGGTDGVLFPYARVAMQHVLQSALPPRSVVLLPAYTCAVVAHAIVAAGHRPRFLDIRASDFNTPTEAFLDALDSDVGAVIPTHMYGTPLDLQPLLEHLPPSVLLLEDGALGLHPAIRPLSPDMSAATIYSFGSNKHLSTIRGGMVVTHDHAFAERLRSHRDRHLKKTDWKTTILQYVEFAALHHLFAPALYSAVDALRSWGPIARRMDTRSLDEPAFPADAVFLPTSLQGVLGLSQLDQSHAFIERRRRLAERYTSALGSLSGVMTMSLDPKSHFSHYALRVERRDERKFGERMRAAGVEVGHTFDYVVPELRPYHHTADGAFPVASRVARELVNLPNYPALSDATAERVIDAVRTSLA